MVAQEAPQRRVSYGDTEHPRGTPTPPLQTSATEPVAPPAPRRPTAEQCIAELIAQEPGLAREPDDDRGRPVIRLELSRALVGADGRRLGSLTIRAPRLHDIQQADKAQGGVASSRLILASCARVPSALLDDLALEDFVTAQLALDALSGKALSRIQGGG